MRCELIGPGRLDYYINNPHTNIIDVRPEDMYKKLHITGAYNWPFLKLNTFEGYKKFSQYFADKRVIYVIYCDMGVNSMIAGNNLAAMGYRVKSLVGGISGYKGKELVTSDN